MNQSDFAIQLLPERSVLRVRGPDARPFLHGLLTCDIEALPQGGAAYGALLSPQGKILFDMFINERDDALMIDCARSQKPELLKRLALYKLRSKVVVEDADGLAVAVSGSEAPGGFRDPRSPDAGWRAFVASEGCEVGTGYHLTRIAAGLADTDADLGSGAFFPHEANFDQFGAVSFTKGCYVGQEVVSRMEHRGTARARMLPVRFDGKAPTKGSEIHAGGKPVGTVLGSEGSLALALMRLDRLAEATEPLLSDSVRVEVLKPAFARYDVAGAMD